MPYETSGRIEIWKKSIPFIKKNLFFGHGPQSDRNLLNQNASNIFIYILLCGGIFCITFFYIYLFSLLIQYLRFVLKFKLKNFHKDYLLILVICVYFFFYLEAWWKIVSQFFGIDMIMFLLAVKYMEIFIDFQNSYHKAD